MLYRDFSHFDEEVYNRSDVPGFNLFAAFGPLVTGLLVIYLHFQRMQRANVLALTLPLSTRRDTPRSLIEGMLPLPLYVRVIAITIVVEWIPICLIVRPSKYGPGSSDHRLFWIFFCFVKRALEFFVAILMSQDNGLGALKCLLLPNILSSRQTRYMALVATFMSGLLLLPQLLLFGGATAEHADWTTIFVPQAAVIFAGTGTSDQAMHRIEGVGHNSSSMPGE
jgi:hypothetical protein